MLSTLAGKRRGVEFTRRGDGERGKSLTKLGG